MKTFNASDMAHKRTEIFEAAKDGGAIIQKKNTNGVVLDEFVLTKLIYNFDKKDKISIHSIEVNLKEHRLNTLSIKGA